MMRSVSNLIAVTTIFVILLLTMFGCASSEPSSPTETAMTLSTEETGVPSSTVEAAYKAIQDKDCDSLENLIYPTSEKLQMIQECKEVGDEIVDYKILEEAINGDKAQVKVEVTSKGTAGQKTEPGKFDLIKDDGAWKIINLG